MSFDRVDGWRGEPGEVIECTCVEVGSGETSRKQAYTAFDSYTFNIAAEGNVIHKLIF